MLLRQIALVSKTPKVAFRQLAYVSAALQKQATRDFAPIWEVSATVDPFASLDDVPLGYWPIIVEDDIKDPGAAGVHEDRMGQPFALVEAGPLWSLTASHECLEMLADPFGNRVEAGDRPRLAGGKSGKKGGSSKKPGSDVPERVEFLVEICDPCEDTQFAYGINDVPVSDFYTPSYFDPTGNRNGRYDFRGHITEPRQILPKGYLSWRDSSGKWWQQTFFKKKAEINPLASKTDQLLVPPGFNLRSAIDRATPTPLEDVVTGGGAQGMRKLLADGGHAQGMRHVIGLVKQAIRTGKLLANADDHWQLLGRQKDKTVIEPDSTLAQDAQEMEVDIRRARDGEV